jgi:hypothetical protein
VKCACTLLSETSWVPYLNVIVVKWRPNEWTWVELIRCVSVSPMGWKWHDLSEMRWINERTWVKWNECECKFTRMIVKWGGC